MNQLTGSPAAPATYFRDYVPAWLFLCCLMVALMVLMGGYTRLTGSGLSITEWRPISGALPPVSAEAWREAFAKYKETPEYRTVNAGMKLEEFKRIYLVEYLHRLLGRIAGLIFVLPFIRFLYMRRLDRSTVYVLLAIFALGAEQAVAGWYMVKSGLVGEPRVSHYRLTMHLMFAFAIHGCLLWLALNLRGKSWSAAAPEAPPRYLAAAAAGFTAAVLCQAALGGLVAGLDAGMLYNTFPKMNQYWFPPEMSAMNPSIRNLTENPVTVQFLHRVMAFVVFFYGVFLWRHAVKNTSNSRTISLFKTLIVVLCCQMLLGITTLVFQVPLAVALLHQAGALALFTVSLFINHHLYAIGAS